MNDGSAGAATRTSTLDDQPGVGITIRQRLLRHASSIPLAHRCRHILPSSVFARHAVVAVLDDAVCAFDLGDPHSPTLVHSCRLPGVRGAVNWPDGLLTFGDGGFASIDRDLRKTKVGPDGPCDEVLDAVPGAGAWYVLDRDAIQVRTTMLCPVSAVAFAGGRCLLRLGHRVLAGGRNGIAVYDTSCEGEPQLEAVHGGIDVAALRPVPEPSTASVVAVLVDGAACALAVADGQVKPTASYPTAPWFIDSLRFRDLLVRISPNRLELDVGVLGPPHLVGAEAMSNP